MGTRNVPEDGWSKEGGEWFNNLDWEDAQYLLTRQVGARPPKRMKRGLQGFA